MKKFLQIQKTLEFTPIHRSTLGLFFLLCFTGGSSTIAKEVELGTPERFLNLVNSSNPCAALFTKTLRATQLAFARDFLKYDAKDVKTGLINALIAHFARTEVLFSDSAEPLDKTNRNSLSYRLRREGHREADRTLTSIILLQKILAGAGHEDFATPIAPLNPGQGEITRIRQIVYDYLTEIPGVELDDHVYSKVKIEKLHALIVRLIIHDQGKFERFIQEYKRRLQDDEIDPSTLSADHDLVLSDIQRRYTTEMLPNIDALLPIPREHMIKSDVGTLNPGRFFQFEAPASHIGPLATLEEQPFRFSLIKEIFDVGGARASEHPNGSFWIKPVISNYFKLYDDYITGRIGSNPQQVAAYYWNILREGGQKLGLPTQTMNDLAVVKLAYLFRLNQFPEEARNRRIQALLRNVQSLDISVRSRLFQELEKNGIDDGWALTLGYIPQVSENIQRAMGTWFSKEIPEAAITEETIESAAKASLEVLFRTVQLARISLKKRRLEGNGEFTLELPGIADFVKRNGVDALLNSEFVFKPAGRNSAEIVAKPRIELPNDTRRAPVSHLWNGATGIFGEGGGGDAVTAAQILNTAVLENGFGDRFNVPVIVSVRENKMGSAGRTGQEGINRSLTNGGKQIAPGVTVVLPESQMIGDNGLPVGRFFEANIAGALKNRGLETQVVLVEYVKGDVQGLAEKYEAIRNHYHLTTIVGVDTGGDKYGPEAGNVHATVDQDQESFEAGRIVYRNANGALTHLIAVAGVGFDSPSYAPEIYRMGFQTDWNTDNEDWNTLSESLIGFWNEIGLTGEQEPVQQRAYYSRTQHALLQAIQGVRGISTTALPIGNVTSDKNPWDPKVYIYPVSAAVLTVDGSILEEYQKQ